MNIVDAHVEWYEDFCNEPRLVLHTDCDKLPNDELLYERRGSLWYAEHGSGYASFFACSTASSIGPTI